MRIGPVGHRAGAGLQLERQPHRHRQRRDVVEEDDRVDAEPPRAERRLAAAFRRPRRTRRTDLPARTLLELRVPAARLPHRPDRRPLDGLAAGRPDEQVIGDRAWNSRHADGSDPLLAAGCGDARFHSNIQSRDAEGERVVPHVGQPVRRASSRPAPRSRGTAARSRAGIGRRSPGSATAAARPAAARSGSTSGTAGRRASAAAARTRGSRPGRRAASTRTISASPRSVSVTFRRPNATRHDWNVSSGKGSAWASASTNRIRSPRPGVRGLLHGPHQHLVAEVGPDDRHAPVGGAVVGEGEVAGAGAQVEDRAVGRAGRDQPRRPAPPALVDVQAQQVVQEVVPRRDLAEHPADAGFALVEQFGEDTAWSRNTVVDAPRCRFITSTVARPAAITHPGGRHARMQQFVIKEQVKILSAVQSYDILDGETGELSSARQETIGGADADARAGSSASNCMPTRSRSARSPTIRSCSPSAAAGTSSGPGSRC